MNFEQIRALNIFNNQTFSTVLILLGIIVIRHLVSKRIQTITMPMEQKRRWIIALRNLTMLAIGASLLVIWGQEIRGVAISLVAFVAALVLATKELITCVTGAVLKAGSDSFTLGDRIEVQGHRGEVIDHNFLTTTLMEVGPGHTSHHRTGRKLVFPNSVFLSNVLINETFNHQYVLHLFSVPMKRDSDWRQAETILLDAAKRASASYIEDARKAMEDFGKRHALEQSRVDPRVTVQFPGGDDIILIVRLVVPASDRGMIEQKILRALAEWFIQVMKDEPETGEEPSIGEAEGELEQKS